MAARTDATDAELLAALWDLVWAGEVTNDSLAPLRSLRRRQAAAHARRRRAARDPGRLTRLGPPAGAGRWSLVAPLLEPAPSSTERAHAAALQLLERHGVLTREAALAEGVEGGFAGVYPVLKALEERGQVRRGYFVAGLGAAQFALPGAVDRLRATASQPRTTSAVGAGGHRSRRSPTAPPCRGPSQGAAGPCPPVRWWCWSTVSAVAYLDRGGRTPRSTFPTAADDDRWVEALAAPREGRSPPFPRDAADRR